jgi:hypothetical protein
MSVPHALIWAYKIDYKHLFERANMSPMDIILKQDLHGFQDFHAKYWPVFDVYHMAFFTPDYRLCKNDLLLFYTTAYIVNGYLKGAFVFINNRIEEVGKYPPVVPLSVSPMPESLRKCFMIDYTELFAPRTRHITDDNDEFNVVLNQDMSLFQAFFDKYVDVLYTYGFCYFARDHRVTKNDLVLLYGLAYIIASIIEGW